jgi:hypothetical protein
MIHLRNKNKPKRDLRTPPKRQAANSVMRYYRPAATRQRNPAERVDGYRQLRSSKSENSGGDHSHSAFLLRIIRFTTQWALFAVIIVLVGINITVSGVAISTKGSEYTYRSSATYIEGIEKITSANVLYRTKVTLSSSQLASEIKKRFPEVSDASIITPLAGRTLSVVLVLSSPLVRLTGTVQEGLFVTQNGIVVKSEATHYSEKMNQPLPSLSVVDVEVQEGTQLLTSNETELIRLLVNEFDGSAEKRPLVSSIEYDVLKREFRVRFTDRDFYAKLTPERESRQQIGSLVKVFEFIDDNREGRESVGPKEYVDVRVSDRLYIR